MKTALLLPLLALGCNLAFAQAPATPQTNTEEVIRRVADRVLANTSFKFKNETTGQLVESTKGLAPSADVRAESTYNKWGYPNGVLMTALMHMSQELNEQKYADYCRHNYTFIFDALPYFEPIYKDAVAKLPANSPRRMYPRTEYASLFLMGNLDNCGAMSAGLSDVYALDARKDYRAYLERAGDYILHKQMRLTDGTLCRPDPRPGTMWADDLYMSVPFLARMGKITGNKAYFDDAAKQVENFNKYLYDANTGLYFHCYYNEIAMNGVAHWGRANGWVAVAQTELLNYLPKDHPKRKELINLLLRDIVGYSRWQDQSGLWHQVLDKQDSYLETSVTAMYIYAIARAVNEGWIDKGYINVARQGWNALAAKITADGQMPDVCVGTGIEEDIKFYYTRPAQLNDTHGLGAFILAGTEMLRYEKNNPSRR
ncbi:rhamnogalacturonyl hydrolase YesR [Mucilaginibacter yixingensis]|uniref:Rhamnogalacturonyl hydrolase YesR n=1 Tax=Mucilaginibacter yixingensis TaxID=1295612 RepID=A0A2T5JGU2_9SPHI|nr:glycoside hydrolase family 88 protein [Mucilaginibacter yixingensis]PTR01614.1 rhamnogalacturonyl hydrolase YesR [Mucilaginibacter yixingensis]